MNIFLGSSGTPVSHSRYLILDRDGVVNYDSDNYIKSPDEWHAIPGSLEAIARLNQRGWRSLVLSNQSGIGRRIFDMDALNAIHNKMLDMLRNLGGNIDAIFFCPHNPSREKCQCRKPGIGLYQTIESRLAVKLKSTPCIGDKLSDMEAAIAVGGKPMLVRTGHGEDELRQGRIASDIPTFANLAEAADYLQIS